MPASAGVLLQANFRLVADYLDMATTVLLVALGAPVVWRDITCWRTSGGACAE